MLIVDPYGRSGVFIGTASTKHDGLQENGGSPWITQTPSTESHAVKLPHPLLPYDSLHFISVFILPQIKGTLTKMT